MTIDGVRDDNSHKLYSSEPKENTCSPDRHKAAESSKAKASVLDAWDRMEASHTPGSDATSRMKDEGPLSTPGSEAARDTGARGAGGADDGGAGGAGGAGVETPPETYEQCVNREAYEGSIVGRVGGAIAGCATGGLAGTKLGLPGTAIGCAAGGVAGYYAGGAGGAFRGMTDGKIICDQPDRPGSPSARALEQRDAPIFRGPIKG